MISVSISKTNNIAKNIKRIETELSKVPRDAIDKFKELTPIDRGYARRNTKLVGDTIEAQYPYAEVLDKGRHMTQRGMRGSTQAPKGMTIPFFKWLQARYRKIFKK